MYVELGVCCMDKGCNPRPSRGESGKTLAVGEEMPRQVLHILHVQGASSRECNSVNERDLNLLNSNVNFDLRATS